LLLFPLFVLEDEDEDTHRTSGIVCTRSDSMFDILFFPEEEVAAAEDEQGGGGRGVDDDGASPPDMTLKLFFASVFLSLSLFFLFAAFCCNANSFSHKKKK